MQENTHSPLTVLWQDAHLVAIHKPAGWLVHRSGLDAHETRVVLQQLRDQLGQSVYPVHRLDKGTCGVLVMALSPAAARALTGAFAAQQVAKRYLALVRGWAPARREVEHALRPDDTPPGTPAQAAHTRFTRLARVELPQACDARFAGTRASLVLAEPTTGRRHQIRRHAKHIAHPLIGDATHGKGPLNRWWAGQLGLQRLWLHAWELRLPHPVSGTPLTIGSGLSLAPGAPSSRSADLRAWQALLHRLPWQAQ